MRVNSRVLTERSDLMGNIQIPTCPAQFKKIAENIMTLLTTPGYAVPDYNSMNELDKMLMLEYWKRFDGMDAAMQDDACFKWYVNKATSPELIRRAREWLISHNYLFAKEFVQNNADKAAEKFRNAMR